MNAELRVIVPGEADAAMDLHRMNGGLHIRIAGTSLGEMRVGGRICIPVIQWGRGVIGGRLGQFHLEQRAGP